VLLGDDSLVPRKKIISDDLMKILACPVCKASLEKKPKKLVCKKCKEEYPIKEGIPILLPPELRD
jgi:hypothetical protein